MYSATNIMVIGLAEADQCLLSSVLSFAMVPTETIDHETWSHQPISNANSDLLEFLTLQSP